jgi:hypothetical protein
MLSSEELRDWRAFCGEQLSTENLKKFKHIAVHDSAKAYAIAALSDLTNLAGRSL